MLKAREAHQKDQLILAVGGGLGVGEGQMTTYHESDFNLYICIFLTSRDVAETFWVEEASVGHSNDSVSRLVWVEHRPRPLSVSPLDLLHPCRPGAHWKCRLSVPLQRRSQSAQMIHVQKG